MYNALHHDRSRVICVSDLQLFVHLFELFFFIRITLRELVDFDPEALDLISHLREDTATGQHQKHETLFFFICKLLSYECLNQHDKFT